MGTDRSDGDLRGILVPDPRLTTVNLTAKDHATALLQSVYTQAGPFAGPAAPDQDTNLVIRTSGDQPGDGEIEILTQRSGGVGLENAGQVWRDLAAGDGTDAYKGWDAPAIVTDWETLLFTVDVQGADIRPHVIRLLSGRLLAAYSVTTLGVVRVSRYDPADSTWTAVNLTPTGAGAGYATEAVTICQLSNERVLAYCLAIDQQQVDVYYSDDDGTTWAAGGYRVLDVGITEETVTDMRVAHAPATQELLLLILWDNSTTGEATATQYASADLGSVFTQVMLDWEVETNESVETLDIIPIDGGGFCVLYIDEQVGNDDLLRRRIGSAFSTIDTATAAQPDVLIDPALDDVAGWADADGVMWFIVGDGTVGAGDGRLGALYRSTDQGDTWERGSDSQGTYGLHVDTDTTERLTQYSAMSLAGRVALVTRWTATTSTYDPQSVAVLWYTGYSTHTSPVADPTGATLANEDFRDTDYVGWGHQFSATGPGGIWYPAEFPAAGIDWTVVGPGGEAFEAGGTLEITTAAQQRYYQRLIADDGVKAVYLDFEVELDDGDGSTAAEEVALTVRLSDGAFQFEIQVRCSSAGYRLYDVNAAANVGAAVTFDLTTKGHIRLAMDDGANVATWYGRGGHVRKFAEGTGGAGLTDGGAGAVSNLIRWGHSGAVANVSRWSLVGYCFWPGRWSGTQTTTLAASWTNPTDLHPRSFPTSPDLLHDGVQIEAVSGPSWHGETQQLRAAYEHPISALDPNLSPSPARDWQAIEDNQDYAITWDLERDPAFADSFWESTSLGCFLINSNIRTAKIQGWTGAAWADIISLNAADGYTALPFTRKGRVVYPDLAGAVPSDDRWSPHMMHAGDSIILDDGQEQEYRRIASNSEGGWRDDTKLARLKLDPDYLDGGEAAAGTCTIIRRNFGGIVHNLDPTTQDYQYVRLLIGRQKTYSGYYQIGSLAIGPVFVFGLEYGNGWSWEQSSNTELITRDSGVRSARVRGGRRRIVEVGWGKDAQDTTRMWDEEPYPDYVTGVTGGDPVASLADTAYQVLGLTERTDGPADTMVYLGRIQRGAGSILYTMDPEWIYGRMVTETASMDQVVGSEGVSPLVRGGKLRFEEEL